MYGRIVYISIALLIILNSSDGRKQRKTQQPKDDDNPAPQPSVLTYSTFGFNDVGSYDGFVPTSPDYSSYHNKYKESSEKLYAPAFPSAPDTDFTSNSQSLNGESLVTGDAGKESSMLQYNNANTYNSPKLKSDADVSKNSVSEMNYGHSSEGNINPVYGSKISSINKNTIRNGYNNNGYNNTDLNNLHSYQSDHKFSNYQESHLKNDVRSSYDESSSNNKQNFYNYATTYPTPEIEDSMKASPINDQSMTKFPKFVDYFNTKSYDTMELENKYSGATAKPLDTFKSMPNSVNDDNLNYFEDHNNKLIKISPSFKNTLAYKDSEDLISQKEKLNTYQGYLNKQSNIKNNIKSKKLNYDYRDEVKFKPWVNEHNSNEGKRIKNNLKGFEYGTNFSSTKFQFDMNEPKKQYNSGIDAIIPSSSNIVDFSNYQFLNNEYLNFKSKPSVQNILNTDNNEELTEINLGNKYNPSIDYLTKFQNFYSTVPTTSTHWGNIFKSSDYSSYKTHIPKPQNSDEENFDTVYITKRPNSNRYGKDSDAVGNDWPDYNRRPTKYSRHKNEWNKENINNRFKSEEDLLGLRNHDTSHPSYLPAFQYSGHEESEESFKKATEKWRENYIKAKYRDTPGYDYETSEAQNVHALNPYNIQVPRPVIVAVPQPYPVRIPLPRPVAVPVMQEITVPIEKPVPYPVYKKVPFPIEKLVPMPVEKQVPVPVVKPYPVAVPQVRPVFHHSRPYREEYDLDYDIDSDDYLPRPDSSRLVYSSKRPKSVRDRLRRPSRMSHQERSKGKPQRRPYVRESVRDRLRRPSRMSHQERSKGKPQRRPYVRERVRRPPRLAEHQRYRYYDQDFDEDRDSSDYRPYCKRTGNC